MAAEATCEMLSRIPPYCDSESTSFLQKEFVSGCGTADLISRGGRVVVLIGSEFLMIGLMDHSQDRMCRSCWGCSAEVPLSEPDRRWSLCI
jgi:hypothetical protein